MIHVVAIITTKPGKREEVLAAALANVPTVRAEKGCIEYVPVVDAPGIGKIQTALGPDSFIVVEKWATKEDLYAHGAAPHMMAYGAKVKDLIAARTIHVLSPA